MKRLLLAAFLALTLVGTAHADGVLVLVDSLAYGGSGNATFQGKNIAPFMDILARSLKPGKKLTVTNVGGSATVPTWTAAELQDSISASGSSPKYDYSLIVCIEATDNSYLLNTNNRKIPQLTLTGNRPKVPVLYMSSMGLLHNYVADDTLGVIGNPIITVDSVLVTSPAGFAFPVKAVSCVKRTSGTAGAFVTPVLWFAGGGYSKTTPTGYSGNSPGARDSMIAWFYNPPKAFSGARAGLGSDTGFGVMMMEPGTANSGTSNYASSAEAVIAVGMAARLAPGLFSFPGARIALDVDDGCKRFSTASSYPQIADALQGLDSLGVWNIPYTLGIEIDSMATGESNGLTRFQNEFTAIRRYGMGKVTVHCHKGMTLGGVIADTTLASAAGHIHTDIFGVAANRVSFGSTSGTTRDQSTFMQLDDATKQLIDYAGDVNLVSGHVMPPTDNYKTVRQNLVDPASGLRYTTFDSISYAISLSGAGYKGWRGYRVVRTQYQANAYNINVSAATSGLPRGFAYALPAAATIGANLTPAVNPRSYSLLYVPSAYIWGVTTDTASTQDYGSLRVSLNRILGTSVGFNRDYDMTTAQEAATAGASSAAARGTAKSLIYVTHLPNWRQGIGVTPTGPYSGGRPAWENVRTVNAAIEAAKWCAQQANTASRTYFTDGPVKWIYSDQFSEKDLH